MKKVITKPKQLLSRLILLIFVLFSVSLNAQDLTEEQKNALLPSIKQILKDYEKYSQFSSDGINLYKEYINKFSSLFDPIIKGGIYNDIIPAGKGTFLTSYEYVSFVITNYPQGLDVAMDIDNIKIENAILKKGVYAVTVKVRKKVTGMFNNIKIHRFNDDLYFTFSASLNDQGTASNLKINGVLSKSKFAQTLTNKQGKGVYLGISGLYAQTKIYSPMSFDSDILDAKPGSSIYPGFDLVAMFTNGFGIGTGVRLSSYQSSFAIGSYSKTSEAIITDEDGDTYNPVLQISNLNQTSTIKSLDIPILLKFRGGKKKTKFYLDLGVIYSKISSATFTLDGNAVRSGYYTEYKAILTDITEYGFGSYNYNADSEYELKTEETTLSGYASLGLMFQLSQSLHLKIGGGLTYGISDLKPDPNNADNYINLVSKEPVKNTTLQANGVEIGLYYRIPSKR
ncbi:MAG: hypothetical protein AB9846_07490 [Tenuifilaceae bacterium]